MAAILSSRSGASSGRATQNSDAACPHLAGDAERRQGIYDPAFEGRDEAADIGAPTAHVEHDVGDALAWPVVGILTTTASHVHREPVRRQQVARPGAGASGIEWRMLQKPDQLGSSARGHGRGAGVHDG